jgi:hypothetical protein
VGGIVDAEFSDWFNVFRGLSENTVCTEGQLVEVEWTQE